MALVLIKRDLRRVLSISDPLTRLDINCGKNKEILLRHFELVVVVHLFWKLDQSLNNVCK